MAFIIQFGIFASICDIELRVAFNWNNIVPIRHNSNISIKTPAAKICFQIHFVYSATKESFEKPGNLVLTTELKT